MDVVIEELSGNIDELREFGSAEDITAIDHFIPKQRLFEDLFQAINELTLSPKYQPALPIEEIK